MNWLQFELVDSGEARVPLQHISPQKAAELQTKLLYQIIHNNDLHYERCRENRDNQT